METLRELFELAEDYCITISLTDTYCLHIEGVNIDYCSINESFDINKMYYLTIELNDYKGNFYRTIQNDLKDIHLDMQVEELREKVLDLAIKRGLDNE